VFATAHDNNANNLNWLALVFFINAVGLPFASSAGNPLGATPASLWIFAGCVCLAQLALLLFIQATFYQNRKSPAEWFLGAIIVAIVATLYGLAISALPHQQSVWTATSQFAICLLWGWQAWASYQAWRGVAKEKTVEDWVKGRYQLVIWYSLFQFVGDSAGFVLMVAAAPGMLGGLPSSLGPIALVCNIASVVLAYLAWAAPAGYYRWLNRNYKPPEVKELSEEEVMRQMMGG
jgi:hypothetical protein